MAAKFRAGKNSATIIQNQNLSNHEWTTTYHGEALETTNFESNGKYQGLTGILKVTWGITAHWDAGMNPLDDPPGLYPRDDGLEMTLYTNTTDAKYWEFPQFLVEDSTVSSTASGLVEFNTSGSSNGDFTPPEGSV